MKRINNIIIDHDPVTGEQLEFILTTTYEDGSAMDDSKLINPKYIKIGSQYFKQIYHQINYAVFKAQNAAFTQTYYQNYIDLPVLDSSSRTYTQYNPAPFTGKAIIIVNRNTSTQFTWNIAGGFCRDINGNPITVMPFGVVKMISDGAYWVITSVYAGERRITAIADITTSDATDQASAISLANTTKAKINQILAGMRSAGLLIS